MITKPTTLILGAGASEPFGFPTGYELLRRVLALSYSTEQFGSYRQTDFDHFKETLKKSGRQSVDSFLEYRDDFVLIGKTAMAVVLIQCEEENRLFNRDGKSWYEYLFSQMTSTSGFDDFDNNKLSILTFNYDRSLEYFLLTVLQNSYNKPIAECANKLKKIPLIHLHGDLGGLPHLENSLLRLYDSKITDNALQIARAKIKIVHEGNETDQQFLKAKQILSDSEVICFLGFGYHSVNMQRLGFSNNSHSGLPYRNKIIRGTSLNMTGARCQKISNLYGFELRRIVDGDSPYFNVLQYLEETEILNGN